MENVKYLNSVFYLNKIVLHDGYLNQKNSKKVCEKSLSNLKKNVMNGWLSDNTKRYISNKLNIWLSVIDFYNRYLYKNGMGYKKRMVMITLTLPEKQKHDDNFIKRNLLNVFLNNMVRKDMLINFFWRAELQKNGNIHFHILTDSYIDKDDLRIEWCNVLRNHNYLIDWEKKHIDRLPPCTDIRSKGDVLHMLYYVTKYTVKCDEINLSEEDLDYIEKNNYRFNHDSDELNYKMKIVESMTVKGRIWGMSDKIRELRALSIPFCSSIERIIDFNKKTKITDCYKSDFFTMFTLKKSVFDLVFDDYVFNCFQEFYKAYSLFLFTKIDKMEIDFLKNRNVFNSVNAESLVVENDNEILQLCVDF